MKVTEFTFALKHIPCWIASKSKLRPKQMIEMWKQRDLNLLIDNLIFKGLFTYCGKKGIFLKYDLMLELKPPTQPLSCESCKSFHCLGCVSVSRCCSNTEIFMNTCLVRNNGEDPLWFLMNCTVRGIMQGSFLCLYLLCVFIPLCQYVS